jgi:DNA repair exonuclease SbcCD nuclease subunit
MNILIVGDPHFKLSNNTQGKEMASQIVNIAKAKKPDFIVILGDTLDRHDIIHLLPFVTSIDFLRQLQDISKVYLIIGNHDRKNNKVYLTENEHPFYSLKYWDNIEIIDTVKFITHVKNNTEYYFTMLPYVEPGRFKEALSLVDYKNSHCIFCHQEFKGVNMGPFKSVDGDLWDEDLYIISGHVHEYQKLQSNILYVGTPIQQSFGENAKKHIILLTIDEPIKTHQNCQYEKIKLDLPIKKIIHLKYDEIAKYKLDEKIEAKIVITASLTEIKTLMKNPKIIKWKKAGALIVYKDLPSEEFKPDYYKHESFTSLLYNEIKNNNDLLSTYTEIFGEPNN